jgi:hypothetical protein
LLAGESMQDLVGLGAFDGLVDGETALGAGFSCYVYCGCTLDPASCTQVNMADQAGLRHLDLGGHGAQSIFVAGEPLGDSGLPVAHRLSDCGSGYLGQAQQREAHRRQLYSAALQAH